MDSHSVVYFEYDQKLETVVRQKLEFCNGDEAEEDVTVKFQTRMYMDDGTEEIVEQPYNGKIVFSGGAAACRRYETCAQERELDLKDDWATVVGNLQNLAKEFSSTKRKASNKMKDIIASEIGNEKAIIGVKPTKQKTVKKVTTGIQKPTKKKLDEVKMRELKAFAGVSVPTHRENSANELTPEKSNKATAAAASSSISEVLLETPRKSQKTTVRLETSPSSTTKSPARTNSDKQLPQTPKRTHIPARKTTPAKKTTPAPEATTAKKTPTRSGKDREVSPSKHANTQSRPQKAMAICEKKTPSRKTPQRLMPDISSPGKTTGDSETNVQETKNRPQKNPTKYKQTTPVKINIQRQTTTTKHTPVGLGKCLEASASTTPNRPVETPTSKETTPGKKMVQTPRLRKTPTRTRRDLGKSMVETLNSPAKTGNTTPGRQKSKKIAQNTATKSPKERAHVSSTSTSSLMETSNAITEGMGIYYDHSCSDLNMMEMEQPDYSGYSNFGQEYGFNATNYDFSNQDAQNTTYSSSSYVCNIIDYFRAMPAFNQNVVVDFLKCLTGTLEGIANVNENYGDDTQVQAPAEALLVEQERRVPLIKDRENPEAFKTVLVNPTKLRSAEMKAMVSAIPANYLMNKVSDLIFSQQDYKTANGVKALDANRLEALKEYLHSKCQKLNIEELQPGKFNYILQNKITNARKLSEKKPKLKPASAKKPNQKPTQSGQKK